MRNSSGCGGLPLGAGLARAACATFSEGPNRVGGTLLRAEIIPTGGVRVSVSWRTLALTTGLGRETIARVVKRLRVEGILRTDDGNREGDQDRDGDRVVTVTKNVAPKSEAEPRGAMTRGEIRETPRKKAPPDQPQGGNLGADQALRAGVPWAGQDRGGTHCCALRRASRRRCSGGRP